MIVYKGVFERLKENGYSTYAIAKERLLSPETMKALRENKSVSVKTITTICRLAKCQPGDIMEYQEDPTEE